MAQNTPYRKDSRSVTLLAPTTPSVQVQIRFHCPLYVMQKQLICKQIVSFKVQIFQ
jgi:hypothetical protein